MAHTRDDTPKTNALACANAFKTLAKAIHQFVRCKPSNPPFTPNTDHDTIVYFSHKGISLETPHLDKLGFAQTAHQRLTLEAEKEALLPLCAAFQDACRLHPAIGAVINLDPMRRIRLYSKGRFFALEFGNFYVDNTTAPWRTRNQLASLIQMHTTAPKISYPPKIYLHQHSCAIVASVALTDESCLPFFPFLTCDPGSVRKRC